MLYVFLCGHEVDVYPNLTVEIFTPGGEGTPLEIHASIHLKTPERPSNIKNLKLTPIALTYEILGTSCTYKIDSKAKGLLTKQANCQ